MFIHMRDSTCYIIRYTIFAHLGFVMMLYSLFDNYMTVRYIIRTTLRS